MTKWGKYDGQSKTGICSSARNNFTESAGWEDPFVWQNIWSSLTTELL
jgi:hypothetical protein